MRIIDEWEREQPSIMNNSATIFKHERFEMGTFGVEQKKHLFMFDYTDADGATHSTTTTGYDHWDAKKGLPNGVTITRIQKII